MKKFLSNTKNLIITIFSAVLIFLSIGIGIGYAISIQASQKTPEIEIRSSTISFLFNNRRYIDKIGVSEIEIAENKEADIKMEVSATGVEKTTINYTIKFNIEESDDIDDTTKSYNSLLANAIEVYYLKDGDYVYISQLSDLFNGDISEFSGTMSTIYSDTINLRFLLPETTSKDFDNDVKKANFSIKAIALFSINNNSNYVYASSSKEFITASQNKSNLNKTIVLVNNITLPNSFNINQRVGIDLRGNKLTLNGNINIEYSTNETDHIGIVDSYGTGLIDGNGVINVKTNECYLVAKNLIETNKVNIDLSNSTVFDDFIKMVEENINKFTDKYFESGEDLSNIFNNIEYYLSETKYSYRVNSDNNFLITDNESTDKIELLSISNDENNVITNSKYIYTLSFDDTVNSQSKTVSGSLLVRGNDFISIATQVESLLPETINSSIYFKTYDSTSGTNIEWIVEDGFDGKLLDNNGLYRKNGIDFAIELDSYDARIVTFYIKLSKDNDVFNENDVYYYKFTKKVEVLSYDEITSIWFDNEPVVLSTNDNNEYSIDTLLVPSQVELTSYEIKFMDENSKLNDYLEISEDLSSISIKNIEVPNNYNETDYFIVSFNYDGYLVDRKIAVTLLGESSYIIQYDIQFRLKNEFNLNSYIDGLGNEFYPYGSLSTNSDENAKEVLIDYKIDAPEKDYISIIYEYKPVTSVIEDQVAYYLKNGNAYTYIPSISSVYTQNKNLETGYTPINNDDIIQGNTYYTIDDNGDFIPTTIYSLKRVESNKTYYKLNTYINYKEVSKANIEIKKAYYTLNDGKFTQVKFNSLSEIDSGTTYYSFVPNDTEGSNQIEQEIYAYSASVEILLSKVPAKDNITAKVTATLYTLKEDGSKFIFEDGTYGYLPVGKSEDNTENWEELVYNFTFPIEGIIHNDDTGIPDYSLYSLLLSYYDDNNDGILTMTEAKKPFEKIEGLNTAKLTNYKYLDLTGYTYTSIKGLEYFTNLEGLSLAGTKISDISSLRYLKKLKYLDLSNNQINTLDALSLSDNLEYLNLSTNTYISSVEALRNLKSLKKLNLANDSITNFEPLIDLTTLEELIVDGMTDETNMSFNRNTSIKYYFALILDNNENLSSVHYSYGTDNSIVLTNEEMVAAKVMRDLEEINYVKNVLYLPTKYHYANEIYELEWSVLNNDSSITFLNAEGKNYQDYIIESPIFDKKLTIYVQVINKSTQGTYSVSRNFNITLEKSSVDNNIYIYNGDGYVNLYDEQTGKYSIPDTNLINAMFASCNVITDENISIGDGNEKNTISLDDYSSSKFSSNLNWSNKGIVDLEGIDYLKYSGLTNLTLDLSGNPIDDSKLSLLKELDGIITTLILGGKEYDLSYLAKAGLTKLKTLDVSKCYEITSEESLNNLYQIYYENIECQIYIETTYNATSPIVWNPYEDTIDRSISNLVSILTFERIKKSYNMYDINNSISGEKGIALTFYGHQIYFAITNYSFYEQSYNATDKDGNRFIYNKTTHMISFDKPLGRADSSYVNFTIGATDNHIVYVDGNAQNNTISAKYLVQLITADSAKYIIVHDLYDGDKNVENGKYYFPGTEKEEMALSDIYGNSDLLRSVLYSMYISTDWLRNTSNNKCSSIEEYITFVKGNKNSNYKYYFDDKSTGLLHITTELLKNLSVTASYSGKYYYWDDNSRLSSSNSATPSTSGVLQINGYSENGKSPFYGLKYLEKCKSVEILYNADFGDGSDLISIENLFIAYCTLDLTTLTTKLPKLKTISCYDLYYFRATEEVIRNCLTSLIVLSLRTSASSTIGDINDFSFLKGFIKDIDTATPTTTLRGLLLNNIYKSPKNKDISTINAEYIKELYKAALNSYSEDKIYYKVGDVGDNSNASVYVGIDPENDLIGTRSTNTATTLNKTWGKASSNTYDSSITYTNDENYSKLITSIKDTGLRVNDDLWYANKPFSLTNGDVLSLPTKTYLFGYGLDYDDPTIIDPIRNYDVEWSYYWNPKNSSNIDIANITANLVDSRISTATGFTYEVASNDYNRLTINSSDGFLVLIGIIKHPSDTGKNKYYVYYFNVNSGDNVFSPIEDNFLRGYFLAYYTSNKENTTNMAIFKLPSSKISYNKDISINIFNGVMNVTGNYQHINYGNSSDTSNDNDLTNYIYSLNGIDNAFNKCLYNSKLLIVNITKVSILGQVIKDVEPIINAYLVSNNQSILRTLDLNKYYFSLPTNISNLTGLKTLNLENAYNISIDDLKLIPTTITKLDIYGTRCVRNYEVVNILTNLVTNNSSKSLSLKWNVNSFTTVDISTINDFIDKYDTIDKDTINYIVNDGSFDNSQLNVVGENLNAIKDYQLVKKEVNFDVTVLVTYKANDQFTNIYKKVNYSLASSSTEETVNIGNGTKTLLDFDTELIFYLLNLGNDYFGISSGKNYYDLKKDVTITSKSLQCYGLSSLKGFDNIALSSDKKQLVLKDSTLSYSIKIDLNGIINSNVAYPFYPLLDEALTRGFEYPGTTYDSTYGYCSDTSNKTANSYKINDIYSGYYVLTKELLNYPSIQTCVIYQGSTDENTFKVILPSQIGINGTMKDMNYSITGNGGLNATYIEKISIVNGVIKINTSDFSGLSVKAYTLTISASFITTGTNTKKVDIQLIINIQSSATKIDKSTYSLYIEVEKDDSSDDYVIKDEDGSIICDDDGNEYRFKSSEVIPLYSYSNDVSYSFNKIEATNEVKAYVIDGTKVFESGRFMEIIMAKYKYDYTNTDVWYDDDACNGAISKKSQNLYKGEMYQIYKNINGEYVISGIILTKTYRLSVLEINMVSSNSYINSYNVTSLAGIQIFANATSFDATGGAFIRIDAFRYLKNITDFNYRNSYYENNNTYFNYQILNFAPLIDGAKDTLVNFYYNGYGSTQITDLSFLLSFNKLKNIYIGNNFIVTTNSKNLETGHYFKTSSFKFLLSQFESKGIKIYINKNIVTTQAQEINTQFSYNETTGEISSLPRSYQTKGNEYLNEFEFNNDYGYLKEDYILKLKQYEITNNDYLVTFYVPAAINVNGTFHVLTWEKAQSTINVLGYYVTNTITVDGKTYSPGIKYSKEDAEKIVSSIDFFTEHKSGKIDLLTQSTLTFAYPGQEKDLYDGKIVARLTIDNWTFDRMFTLEF